MYDQAVDEKFNSKLKELENGENEKLIFKNQPEEFKVIICYFFLLFNSKVKT